MFSTTSQFSMVIFACLLTTSTANCPALWTQFKDHCYRYFGYRMDWYDAESFCNNFSPPGSSDADLNDQIAHLVAINSWDEQNFVYKYWESTRETLTTTTLMWIGFHKPNGQNYFQWSNRDDITYTNWDTNRPNNVGGNEDCVEMWEGQGQADTHKGKSWNDRPCEHKMSFMCEMSL